MRWRMAVVTVSLLAISPGVDTRAPAAAPTTSFEDVPERHWAYHYIETLYQHGYVAGCSASPRRYCPDDPLTRAQMAVFIVRGVYGPDYTPPDPTVQIFSDVPLDSWAAKWIHKVYADGYTTGCATDPLRYCPESAHTRAEATVFFLRILNGRNFSPPSPKGLFADVPVSLWYAAWVEAAYTASLIPPCQIYPQSRFCPDVPISRAMAAYVMTQVKGLISSPDNRVLNMEITQGVQNLASNMPLVAGRNTYVRAYVRSTVFRKLYDVPARLRAFRNGVELPGSPRTPNNAGKTITVGPNARRPRLFR